MNNEKSIIINALERSPIYTMSTICLIGNYKEKLHTAYEKKIKDIQSANDLYSEEIKNAETKRDVSNLTAEKIFYETKLELCYDYLNHVIEKHPFCLIYNDICKKAKDSEYRGWLQSEILTFVQIIKGYIRSDPNLSSLFSDDVLYEVFQYEYDLKTGKIFFRRKNNL